MSNAPSSVSLNAFSCVWAEAVFTEHASNAIDMMRQCSFDFVWLYAMLFFKA